MAHGRHSHIHHVGSSRIHRSQIRQYQTHHTSHSTQHSSSFTLPPEQIFQYTSISLMKVYEIFFRFFSEEHEDVQYLRANGIIPSDVPVFQSDAAAKLYYSKMIPQYKVVSGIFGCWMVFGLILFIVGIALIASIGDIGFVGLIVFGLFAFFIGLLMFCCIVGGSNNRAKKYVKPYICHKMSEDEKQQLQAQAIADGDQYYQRLLQYNTQNPQCQYVSQIILAINNIKQGQQQAFIISQQALTQPQQRSEIQPMPVQPVQQIQPPQLQQQTVSNEQVNQFTYDQNIPMPGQNVDQFQSPPVL